MEQGVEEVVEQIMMSMDNTVSAIQSQLTTEITQ